MTPEQATLVQKSFAEVAPIADEAAAMFYRRLFEIAPQVRPLFKTDIRDQGRKLMLTLNVVVNSLSNLPAILPAAGLLAKRHLDFGVTADHYDVVGEALIWTLERGLGPLWNDELAAAWAAAYAMISGHMIEEAYGNPAAA
jgi:hemoglobin-like flavoprotein